MGRHGGGVEHSAPQGRLEEVGYTEFHEYCHKELLLTEQTVDKLTGSYAAVRQHAPKVLQRDGVAEPLPALDAVDYFAKVLRESPDEEEWADDSQESFDDFKQAVFDDAKSVAALKRTFNPIFFPKPEGQEEIEALEKTRSATRRLEGLLQRVELDEKLVERVCKALVALREELVKQIPEAKARQEKRAAN